MMKFKRRGVSLMELLIVVVIGSVICGAIVSALMSQVQLSATQNRTMINSQNLRESLDYMGDEISNIGAGTTEPFIDTATTSELRFTSDVDGDGTWNRVRYYLQGTTLRRQFWNSTNAGTSWTEVADDALMTGVTALVFTYSQPGNTASTTNNDITLIQVALTQDPSVDTTAFNSNRVATGMMSIRATVRNRML
jgi:prepilin-type N-terminal cleavage/methylation domain-containing protein